MKLFFFNPFSIFKMKKRHSKNQNSIASSIPRNDTDHVRWWVSVQHTTFRLLCSACRRSSAWVCSREQDGGWGLISKNQEFFLSAFCSSNHLPWQKKTLAPSVMENQPPPPLPLPPHPASFPQSSMPLRNPVYFLQNVNPSKATGSCQSSWHWSVYLC